MLPSGVPCRNNRTLQASRTFHFRALTTNQSPLYVASVVSVFPRVQFLLPATQACSLDRVASSIYQSLTLLRRPTESLSPTPPALPVLNPPCSRRIKLYRCDNAVFTRATLASADISCRRVVCLSVRLSRVGVLLKRLNVGSRKQRRTIALQGL